MQNHDSIVLQQTSERNECKKKVAEQEHKLQLNKNS